MPHEHDSFQAPWDAALCATSMKVNGLYEASGLALWLRTGSFALSGVEARETGDVSIETLSKFVDNFFGKDCSMKASVLRGSKKTRVARERLLWPVEMICCVGPTHVEGLATDEGFDASLQLVGCHIALWAWYFALFQALVKQAHCHSLKALTSECLTICRGNAVRAVGVGRTKSGSTCSGSAGAW